MRVARVLSAIAADTAVLIGGEAPLPRMSALSARRCSWGDPAHAARSLPI